MKGDKYIDDITKTSFKSYAQEANYSWGDFYLKHGKGIKPNVNFFSKFENVKKIAIAVAGVSVFTAGMLYYSSITDTITINKVDIVNRDVKNINYNDAKAINITSEEFDTKNEAITKKNNNIAKENVVITVKVPVHKKVKVRKQIIINDSIN